MKELKVGDSFLFAEDLYAVTEIAEFCYSAKSISYPNCALILTKDHECFQALETTKHIHTLRLYEGFTDTYRYCIACDHKEKN